MARSSVQLTSRPVVLTELNKSTRQNRYPSHKFYVKFSPYVLQPFMIAPVLPGETLKNLLLQSRGISDMVVSKFLGWWSEKYFFYVKLRDLHIRDDVEKMILDPTYNIAAVHGEATSAPYYHYGPVGSLAVNWTKHCLQRIVEEYFRNEGEDWDQYLIDGLPVSSINVQDWTDSLHSAAEHVQEDVELTVGGDGLVTASEIESVMAQWAVLREHGLVQMSFEDYMRAYGVRAPRVEQHKPELIRYVREWTYPSVTTNDATGATTQVVETKHAERADKDRYFTEPGFIIGVTCVRPKVYLGHQTGSVSHWMDNIFTWLPPQLHGEASHTLRQFAADTGPVWSADVPYYVDLKDLLMYGDQFQNGAHSVGVPGGNFIALPATADLQRRYMTQTMVEGLFNSAAARFFREEGVVNLTIASRQRDTSPTTV